jgi:uncharacterized protein (UPF0332 family)
MKTTIFSHHLKNVKSHIHAGVMEEFSLNFVHYEYIDKNCVAFRRMVSRPFGSSTKGFGANSVSAYIIPLLIAFFQAITYH